MLNEMQHSHINNNNRIRSELLGKTLNRIMANVKSYGEADEDYIREQMDIIRELYHIETNKD